MKVYEAVANAFLKEGTSTIFGLLGDGQVTWWSEMSKHPDIKIIDVRHEGAALAMAEGWARVTGKVGVCSTTQGPGVSHLGSSLLVSSRGRIPLVVYASSAPLNDEDHPQYLDQKKFVSATSAGYVEVLTPGFAEEAVRQAFYRARVESRPIVLSVPLDIQGKECDADGDDYQPSWKMFSGQQRIQPDVERLNEAAKIIAESKKPVVLVGRGAMWSQAGEAAGRLAQRIGALITTTLLTKGLLGDSEYHAGISGLYSTRTAIQLFEEADCVIAIGASLNRYTLGGGYLYPNARIIHIGIAQHVVMGGHRRADCYIQGDATITLQAIEEMLAKKGVTKTGFRTAAVREALRNASGDPGEFEIEPGTVDPREVVKIIDERLPSNVGVVYAGGHQRAFSLMMMNKPRAPHIYAGFFGCIGQGLPTAIGAAVALNGTPLIVIDGDGGALQNIQELDTAARLGVKLLVVIMNDEAYGAEYHKLVVNGLNRNLSVVRSPDFAAAGRAFGCRGRLARTLDEVATGIDEFMAGDGPMVLDIRTSRNVISIVFRRLHFGQDV